MDTPGEIRAIIYVPSPDEKARWWPIAVRHCDENRYLITGLVVGSADGDGWPDVIRMLADGDADLVVIGCRAHLPTDRLPRVEVVTEVTPPRRTGRQRRPRAVN